MQYLLFTSRIQQQPLTASHRPTYFFHHIPSFASRLYQLKFRPNRFQIQCVQVYWISFDEAGIQNFQLFFKKLIWQFCFSMSKWLFGCKTMVLSLVCGREGSGIFFTPKMGHFFNIPAPRPHTHTSDRTFILPPKFHFDIEQQNCQISFLKNN